MLHDKFLPTYHFSEKHEIEIHQSPEAVYQLINEFDFSGSLIIRALFKIRGLTSRMTLKKGLLQEHFIELENMPGRELILGLIGQFWKPNGNLRKVNAKDFRSFHEPGFAKATWNFEMASMSRNITLLRTETRIECLDAEAYTFFSRYWFLIRPFSGLIRKEMLRAIKKKAENKKEYHV